jgi:hypothetical protein
MANTPERLRRFAPRVPRCRACRLPRDAGRRLIAGPGVFICESCIALAAARKSATATAERCAFCRRRDVPIAGAWPSFAICTACIEIARHVLAEDDRRTPQAI